VLAMGREPEIAVLQPVGKGHWQVQAPFTLGHNNSALESLIYCIGFGVMF
jgi:hypothetical protein